MNSFMGGRNFGAASSWVVWPLPSGTQDPSYPVYLKDSELKKPAQTWLLADEDQASINDCMLLMSVGTARFYDLPSRAHGFAYGLNFNDGHAEIYKLMDAASKSWIPGGAGGPNDWTKLKDVTTHPY